MFQHTIIPWSSHVRYPGVTLDSKLLYNQYITSVTHRAFGALRLFFLLARRYTLSLSNKLNLYKLIIRSILVYAAPVWSNTSLHNYRGLQVSPSKCLCVIGNYPRRTPISLLHSKLNVLPIRDLILYFTDKFFNRCLHHSNHLISSIGNYSLSDLHNQYKNTSTNALNTFFSNFVLL